VDDVARLSATDRADLFRAAADRKGIAPPLIEKDFWVCWMLRRVFTLRDPPADILFKGGTSLSKAFGLIDRFSEDIDLVLDRHGLGFTDARDPADASHSGKRRKALLEELSTKCQDVIRSQMLPMLTASTEAALGKTRPGLSWQCELANDDSDQQTILFHYPAGLEQRSQYVRPMIRLEFGARGDHWPSVDATVTPYAAEAVPKPFGRAATHVRVLAPERTFWEKATILHMLHHRPADKRWGERQARHFYDLIRLAESDAGTRALSQLTLLEAVAKHKSVFFASAAAHYEEAKPESLRLVPPKSRLRDLRTDYAAMRQMFFGEPPDFDSLLNSLEQLESRINASS
jgi:hypothetical protein